MINNFFIDFVLLSKYAYVCMSLGMLKSFLVALSIRPPRNAILNYMTGIQYKVALIRAMEYCVGRGGGVGTEHVETLPGYFLSVPPLFYDPFILVV